MPVIIDGTLGVNAAAVTTTNWNPTNLSIPGNATIGDASSDTLTINGASVTFAGTATRIKADFSNDTVANQAFFQTTIANTSTQLRAIPNGNGTQSGLFLYGSSDIDNNSWGAIRTVSGSDVRIQSHTTGSGTLLPITFMTGTAERMRIDTAGNVGIGSASPSSYGKLVIAGNSGSGVTALSVLSGGNAGDYGVVAVGVSNAQKGRLVSDANSGNFRLDTAGTTGAMTFHTGASYTEALRIDNSGNVGIGTASPLSGVGVNLTLSQSLALGVTSATTGDIVSSGGGNSTTYNGVAIISNARSLSGSANSAVASWIVDVGGRAADGTTFNVNKSDTFSISRKLGAGNFYGSSEFLRINSTGNLGIATTSPEFKLDIAESTVPLRRITTNPGGHAINSGYLETRNVGIALSALGTEWITKTSVPSGYWIVKLTGVWENNLEGGGLVPPPAETYIHPNYPYIYVGSVQVQVLRDSGSGRLYLRNNDSAYAVHFTGEISITSVPQGYVPGYSANHFSMNLTGNSTHVNQGMSGGLVLSTPCYSEYQFRWAGLASHTTTLTCGSYQMSEIIYTAHQSNSGTDNNEYVRGKWSNNHDSHIWTEFEHSGNIDAMTTSFTVSQDTVFNSGKLIIQETYPYSGPSYSFSNLIVRCYYGGFSISHT